MDRGETTDLITREVENVKTIFTTKVIGVKKDSATLVKQSRENTKLDIHKESERRVKADKANNDFTSLSIQKSEIKTEAKIKIEVEELKKTQRNLRSSISSNAFSTMSLSATLNDRLSDLESNILTLNNIIANDNLKLERDINDSITKISQLDNAIKKNISSLKESDEKIRDNNANLKKLNSDLNSSMAEVEELIILASKNKVDILAFKKKDENNSLKLSQLDNAIKKNISSLDDLSNREELSRQSIQEIENKQLTVENKTHSNEIDILSLSTARLSNEGKIQDNIDNISKAIVSENKIKSDIISQSVKIAINEGNIRSMDTRIYENINNIAKVTAQISSIGNTTNSGASDTQIAEIEAKILENKTLINTTKEDIESKIDVLSDASIGLLSFTLLAECPDGYIEVHGQNIDDYPKLADKYRKFQLLDLTGQFLRVAGEIDEILAFHSDTTATNGLTIMGKNSSFAKSTKTKWDTRQVSDWLLVGDATPDIGYLGITINRFAQVVGDAETAPKNVVLKLCVKAK